MAFNLPVLCNYSNKILVMCTCINFKNSAGNITENSKLAGG